MILKKI